MSEPLAIHPHVLLPPAQHRGRDRMSEPLAIHPHVLLPAAHWAGIEAAIG